jgi:hypothetical protein
MAWEFLGFLGNLIGSGQANQMKRQQSQMMQSYGERLGRWAEKNKPQAITYNIPQAVLDATKMYDKMYTGGLPGEDIIREQMGAGVAGAVGGVQRGADTSAGALGATTGLYDRYISSVRDLGVQSAQMRQQQEQQKLMAQAEAGYRMGDYQDKAWEYNVNLPYQRQYNEYWQAKNASQQFLWGGLDRAGSAAVDAAGNASNMFSLYSMMPRNGYGASQKTYPSYQGLYRENEIL